MSVATLALRDRELYAQYQSWKMNQNLSWESFIEWHELKRKADLYDGIVGDSGAVEDAQ